MKNTLQSKRKNDAGHDGEDDFIDPGQPEPPNGNLTGGIDKKDQGKDKGEVKTSMFPFLEDAETCSINVKERENDAEDENDPRRPATQMPEPQLRIKSFNQFFDLFPINTVTIQIYGLFNDFHAFRLTTDDF